MNNTFNWTRFYRLAVRDLHHLWPSFGTTMLILALVPSMLWLFLIVLAPDSSSVSPDIRLLIIEAMAILAAIMTPSRLYRTWNIHGEGIYFAMLPASKFEKYVSAVLYSLIVCPLMVLLGGILADTLLTLLPFGHYTKWIWQGEMGFPVTFNFSFLSVLAGSASDLEMMTWMASSGKLFTATVWMQYLANVFLFICTSTVFRRHKVLQTLLWTYLIEFVLSILLTLIATYWIALHDDIVGLVEAHWQQSMSLLLWIGFGINTLIAIVSGYLGWHRLQRMAY